MFFFNFQIKTCFYVGFFNSQINVFTSMICTASDEECGVSCSEQSKCATLVLVGSTDDACCCVKKKEISETAEVRCVGAHHL